MPGSLEDGVTYYVTNSTAGSFKLAASEGGSALSFNTSGLSGSHFFSPAVDIDDASGEQTLRIDLPAGATTSGTDKLLGPGGVPLSVVRGSNRG